MTALEMVIFNHILSRISRPESGSCITLTIVAMSLFTVKGDSSNSRRKKGHTLPWNEPHRKGLLHSQPDEMFQDTALPTEAKTCTEVPKDTLINCTLAPVLQSLFAPREAESLRVLTAQTSYGPALSSSNPLCTAMCREGNPRRSVAVAFHFSRPPTAASHPTAQGTACKILQDAVFWFVL